MNELSQKVAPLRKDAVRVELLTCVRHVCFCFTFSVPTSEMSPGAPAVGHLPPSSKASRPPLGGSCPPSSMEPTQCSVVELEILLEDVLSPLERALEDCRGHTKVSGNAQMQVWFPKAGYLTLQAMPLNPFLSYGPLQNLIRTFQKRTQDLGRFRSVSTRGL